MVIILIFKTSSC